MTFKHVKFEDSEVMRSLEKVGVQKGIVKAEAPTKSINELVSRVLRPSGNLTQDIVTLCNGLKREGLGAYASELEQKFIMFKRAESLYETSKESGEDMVNSAHPDGSHKLEGLLGDAVVETILDQHLAFLNSVNKKPTGKLASQKYKDLLWSVAQDASVAPTETPMSAEERQAQKEAAEEEKLKQYRMNFAKRYLRGCLNFVNEAQKAVTTAGEKDKDNEPTSKVMAKEYFDKIIELLTNYIKETNFSGESISKYIIGNINLTIKKLTNVLFDESDEQKKSIAYLNKAKEQATMATKVLSLDTESRDPAVEKIFNTWVAGVKATEQKEQREQAAQQAAKRPAGPDPLAAAKQELNEVKKSLSRLNAGIQAAGAQLTSALSSVDDDAADEAKNSQKTYDLYSQYITKQINVIKNRYIKQLQEYYNNLQKAITENSVEEANTLVEVKPEYDGKNYRTFVMEKFEDLFNNKIKGKVFGSSFIPKSVAQAPATKPVGKAPAAAKAPPAPPAAAVTRKADDGFPFDKRNSYQYLLKKRSNNIINAVKFALGQEEYGGLEESKQTQTITDEDRKNYALSILRTCINYLNKAITNLNISKNSLDRRGTADLAIDLINGVINETKQIISTGSPNKLPSHEGTLYKAEKYIESYNNELNNARAILDDLRTGKHYSHKANLAFNKPTSLPDVDVINYLNAVKASAEKKQKEEAGKKQREDDEKKQREEAQGFEAVKLEVEQKKRMKEIERKKLEMSLSEFDKKFREINRLKIRVNALLKDRDFFTDRGLADWAKSELAELVRLEREYNITDEDQQEINLPKLIQAINEESSYITQAEKDLEDYKKTKVK